MTSAVLTPTPVQQFFDDNGQPLVGGQLFTYAAGTTTPIDTYTDSSGGTPNTNPIILDARGEAQIWLLPNVAYKFVLSPANDTNPPTDPIWTVDNITVPSGASGSGLVVLFPSGGDDAPTINGAMNFTNFIQLGNGDFKLGSPINITRSGQTLIGLGSGTTTLTCTTASNDGIVLASSCTNVHLGAFTLNRNQNPSGTATGVNVGSSINLTGLIFDIVSQGHERGFLFGSSSYTTCRDLQAVSNFSHGYEFSTTASNPALQYNLYQCNSSANNGYGFYVHGSSASPTDFTLLPWTNCTTFANTLGGIYISGSTNVRIGDFTLIGGIYGADNNDIIKIDGYAGNYQLTDVFVYSAGQVSSGVGQATSASGVGEGINITANNVMVQINGGGAWGNSYNGIQVAAPCSITNVIAANNGKGLTNCAGISCGGDPTNLEVIGCQSGNLGAALDGNTNSQAYGFACLNGSGTLLVGNDFTGNATSAVHYYSNTLLGIAFANLGFPSGVQALTAGTGITLSAETGIIEVSVSGGSGTVTSVTGSGEVSVSPTTGDAIVSLGAIADSAVLANSTGSSAAPVGVNLSTFLDHAIGSTNGALMERGGLGWGELVPGSDGQVLTMVTGAPTWSTVSGTGTVTSIATSGLVSGGPITTTGTISLSSIADSTVVGNNTGSSAVPSAVTITGMLDHALGSTPGALAERGLADWTALNPGTSGQVLTINGSGNPTWTTPGTGGTVTNIATSGLVTGGPITTTGTIALSAIADKSIVANDSGSSAAPTAVNYSAFLDYCVGSTLGSLFERSSLGWGALAPGSNGQVLTIVGGAPTWSSSGGTITGVTAGTNMSGGGSSGSVTLSVVSNPTFSGTITANGSPGLSLPNNGNIDLGSAVLSGNASAVTLTGVTNFDLGMNILPGSNNTYKLGQAGSIWADIQSNTGTFAGLLTATGGITVPSTASIKVGGTNITGTGSGGTGGVMTLNSGGFTTEVATGFYPATTNTYQLGGSSLLWSSGYITGGVWTGSDYRLKHDINDIDLGLDWIMSLRPVSYRWNNPHNGPGKRYGFIAQEIAETLVGREFGGLEAPRTEEEFYHLIYPELIAPMVKAIQQLTARLERAETRIRELS